MRPAMNGVSPMDLMGAGSIIGAGADVLMGALNFGQQQQNLAYQKDLQQQMFQREDNAVQRRVADLRAAGLSPTLAAGSSAQAGPVVSTQAPQLNLSASEKMKNIFESQSMAMALAKQKADISKTESETRWIDQQAQQSGSRFPKELQMLDSKIISQLSKEEQDVLSADIARVKSKILGYEKDGYRHISPLYKEKIRAQFDAELNTVVANVRNLSANASRTETDNAIQKQVEENFKTLGLSKDGLSSIIDIVKTIVYGISAFKGR